MDGGLRARLGVERHGSDQRALQIVDGWIDRKDEPGDWTFTWQPLVDTPELAIITGTTTYRDPPLTYSNLWVLRLGHDGRCSEFTEWWMLHETAEA